MKIWWFLTGAGAGIYAAVKARRAAEVFTPEGMHDRVAGLQRGWSVFTDEVRTGMNEKEDELRQRMLLSLDSPKALPAGSENERLEHH